MSGKFPADTVSLSEMVMHSVSSVSQPQSISGPLPTSRQHTSGQQPLISFVIPVYNIAAYLPRCLNSITEQAFKDIEIIAVDGASDDASMAILDERKKVEPRLTVLHRERIGPGSARNEGARHARGLYIWFVDGDDLLSADCLTAIAHSIQLNMPDVLLTDHDIIHNNGTTESGPGRSLMARKTSPWFTLADEPWVIELGMACWNKIIRRNFFVDIDAAFLQPWPHEDIPVSYSVLLEARRLSVLNEVCYHYRKDRPGSEMKPGEPRRHFRVFDAWRPLLEDVGKRAGSGDPVITKDIRCSLFERAIWHYSIILDTGRMLTGGCGSGSYVAHRDRREFFSDMHWDYVNHAPPGYRPGGGLRGVKFRLIARNAYRTYSLLDPLNKLRMRASRARRRVWSIRRTLSRAVVGTPAVVGSPAGRR